MWVCSSPSSEHILPLWARELALEQGTGTGRAEPRRRRASKDVEDRGRRVCHGNSPETWTDNVVQAEHVGVNKQVNNSRAAGRSQVKIWSVWA